ncbi:MAG: M48 family metallopeptidase [Acidobacteriaceae bacterium]|nr:M48 family metallopeptidase [Acidobacteriaceae bacterium]
MLAVQSYTLPPDKLAQAIQYAHARNLLYFSSVFVSLAVLAGMIWLRFVPRIRHWASAWIVCAVTLLTSLFDLPGEIYAHAMSLQYGISIQSWQSWFWDWAKGELVGLVIAVIILVPFYALLRKSPARWWLIAWLVSIPIMLVSAYADPLLLDPLFNKFQPLAAKHADLIDPIERLLAKAGIHIARDHLFEMEASEKTNSLNAYFTGFGPSSRMVLYDTIIQKENGPPLLTTIGHELGHYALRHIEKGLAIGSLGLLITLWLLYRFVPQWIAKWGARFDIRSISDWSSLPLLLFIVSLLTFVSEPLINAYSRFQEHQADVYGLEVTHGIVASPGQAAAQAFQLEGETDLEVPHPNPLIVFWLYTHPPVDQRLTFSLQYDPWREGHSPEFVK